MDMENKIDKYLEEKLDKKEKKSAAETIALRVKDIIDDNASKEISKKIKEVLKDYNMSEKEIRDITDDIYATLFVRTGDKNNLMQTVLRIAKKNLK